MTIQWERSIAQGLSQETAIAKVAVVL